MDLDYVHGDALLCFEADDEMFKVIKKFNSALILSTLRDEPKEAWLTINEVTSDEKVSKREIDLLCEFKIIEKNHPRDYFHNGIPRYRLSEFGLEVFKAYFENNEMALYVDEYKKYTIEDF